MNDAMILDLIDTAAELGSTLLTDAECAALGIDTTDTGVMYSGTLTDAAGDEFYWEIVPNQIPVDADPATTPGAWGLQWMVTPRG